MRIWGKGLQKKGEQQVQRIWEQKQLSKIAHRKNGVRRSGHGAERRGQPGKHQITWGLAGPGEDLRLILKASRSIWRVK